ncbi:MULTISPECIES: hypothetical protein [unclassified Shewanella]|uniref:hypothetical protein n=1 Tax=unclassified Shewanella TaxID=196818 RepID=UPI000C847792|nr:MULTISPECIES: hypothetical protein [unclassified Shewanella]MDO6618281.1 hypothetical protein [Shewanella sp. 6_MG-2023]MDO6641607.1 hypothetical protein [Shewanella sp. 5_MG-2023]MDO6679949.1 hypothetical protein [Shewanella sp. 4_MG-2023]MDO6775689.1 hypothetical protein [Shewanella sp. 3_MG-2023]PMG28447.1 hypothetical protein BCU94_17335 [Shewanella sp. 10N.286.52.C2]
MSQLNISISIDKLAKLIQSGQLCVADFRSLDTQTKQQLWQLCLLSCKERIHCQHPADNPNNLIEMFSELG